MHDSAYRHGGVYKKWTDNTYSSAIHKTVLTGFVFSFVLSSLLQGLFPFLNPVRPNVAMAGSDTVTWTTTSHFTNNGASGGNYSGSTTANSNVVISNDQLFLNNEENFQLSYNESGGAGYNIDVLDENIAYAARNSAGLYKTIDGGISWTQIVVAGNPDVDDVDFITENVGYIFTSDKVQKTTNGGTSWTVLSNSPTSAAGVIQFIDESIGFATRPGLLTKTTDGGTNWTTLYTSGVVKSYFLNENEGYFVRDIGGIPWKNYYLYKTVDGGSNWSFAYDFNTSGGYGTPGKVDFNDSGLGIVSGDYIFSGGTKGVVYITTDNGISWTRKYVGSDRVYAVYSKNDGTLYAIGRYSHFSTDNGDSWTVFEDNTTLARGIDFYSTTESVGYIIGGNTVITKAYPSYQSPGVVSGYRIDNGTDYNSDWSEISWTGTEPAGTDIKFRTRGSNLTDPSAASITGDASTGWTYWNEDSGGTTYYETSGSSILTPKTRWLEAEVTLETSASNETPVIEDFTVTSSMLAPSEGSLAQEKEDGSGIITEGDWHNSGVKLSVSNVVGFENSTSLYGEFEAKPVGSSFDGSDTVIGTTVSSGEATEGVVNKEAGDYKWRVRLYDNAGRVSPWTEFNSGTSAFQIEQTPPTVTTFTVNSDDEYSSSTSVTLNISANDDGGSGLAEMQFSNNGTDWGATTNADGSIADSGWATYATTHSWDLLVGADDTRTVYARFRDNARNISTDWIETSQSDFDGGNLYVVEVGADGSFQIQRAAAVTSDFPVEPGSIGWINKGWDSSWATVRNATNGSVDQDRFESYYDYFMGEYVNSRSFMAFDTSAIGNDSVVNTVSLYLKKTSGSGANTNIYIVPSSQASESSLIGSDYNNFAYTERGLMSSGAIGSSPTEIPLNSVVDINKSGFTKYAILNDRDFLNNAPATVHQAKYGRAPYLRINYDAPNQSSGEFTSSVRDSGESQEYGAITWSADIPAESGSDALRFQVASSNCANGATNAPTCDTGTWSYVGTDGTAGTYYDTSGTQLHSSHNGDRYIRYKAYLQTADAGYTPTVYDVSIEIPTATSDAITLDTQPPSDITNLKAYTDNTKASELSADTWYPEASPYFEWDANVDSDFNHYEYCFDTSASCTPDQTTANNFWDTSPDISFEGTHYMRVVAVDNAGQQSSNVATFIYKFDASAPGAVTGLAATQTELTKIRVTWNSYSDGASPVDNYKLERVKDSGNEYQIGDDWTVEEGYAVFTLADNTPFDDELGSPAQGQTSIEASVKYQYRISVKDVSNDNYSIYQVSKVYGMTNDLRDPDPVINVLSDACDGTTDNISGTSIPKCSNIANEGFEIAITWTPTSDSGSGVAGYKVYRSTTGASDSYSEIGTTGNLTNFYYDNDTNNDAGGSERLNDYTNYYYRVTAFDASQNANETDLIPVGTDNSTISSTPDVTAPDVPTNVQAEPLGIDSYPPAILPDDPPPQTEALYHQKVQITWDESYDTKARSSAGANDGSGIKEDNENIIGYKLYRSDELDGTYADVTDGQYVTCDLNARICYEEQLQSYPEIYYYKVKAIDSYDNESAQSEADDVQTARSNVPTPPTEVRVNTAEGDPTTNDDVGHVNAITFKGSNAKDCANDIGCLVKYELWRSETNHAGDTDWVDDQKSDLINEFTPTVTGDDRDTVYEYNDTGLSSATTYYYRVRALDNTPEVPDGGPFYSPLSTITTGTLHYGWDTTADDVAPALPSNLKVKDIHGDGSNYLRNIITWERIEDPDRNGTNDFKEYRLYRSNDGLAFEQVCVDGNGYTYVQASCDATYTNPLANDDQELAMATNYFMDLIPVATSNQYFYYYITAVDNAGADYKYEVDTMEVINDYSNESEPARDIEDNVIAVSLNPYIAKPTIQDVSGGDYDGLKAELSSVEVSSAVIDWTTDQSADSLVEYREAGSSDPFIAVGNRDMLINHSVRIFDLEPGVTYEYKVISRNYLANDAIAEGDDLPVLTTSNFEITEGTVVETTSTVEINWSTNIDAKSNFVEWQLQRAPGDEPQSGISGELGDTDPKNHKVVIKGLRSNRKYTYKIKSISNDDFLTETGFLEFTTRGFDSAQFVIEPSSSNIAERNISATSAQIVWETGMAATSWVDYGTTSGQYDYSAGDDILTKTHVVKIENLLSGQTYYYRVRVKDANEVEYVSKEYSFRAIAKPEISDITINEIDPYFVTIAWKTNVETDTLINWGTTSAYGERVGKADSTRHHEITVENLTDDTEYHYQIVARDEYGNEVVDADKVVRTPLDKEGPKVENVKIDILPLGEDAETASVIISWTTNKPASKQVQYDEGVVGGNYAHATTKDETLNNSHTVIIKDLLASTTYHFRIVAADKRGNETRTNDYTFVTPSAEKSIWQLIVKSIEETFSWVSNVGNFFTGREQN